VLLRSDDGAKHPIMVEANVGGRVIAFAGDSTRRWNFFRLNDDPAERTFKQEFRGNRFRSIFLNVVFSLAPESNLVSPHKLRKGR